MCTHPCDLMCTHPCDLCDHEVPDAYAFCPNCGLFLITEDRPDVFQRMDDLLRWKRLADWTIMISTIAVFILPMTLDVVLFDILQIDTTTPDLVLLAIPATMIAAAILVLLANSRIRCPACHGYIGYRLGCSDRFLFCHRCGTRLKEGDRSVLYRPLPLDHGRTLCAVCGKPLQPADRFCGHCGANQTSNHEPEPHGWLASLVGKATTCPSCDHPLWYHLPLQPCAYCPRCGFILERAVASKEPSCVSTSTE